MAFGKRKLDAEKVEKGCPVDINGMTFYVKKMGKIERADLVEAVRESDGDEAKIAQAFLDAYSSLVVGWKGVTPEKLQPYCVIDDFYKTAETFPDDDSDDSYTIKRATVDDVANIAASSYMAQLIKAREDFKDTATDCQIKDIAKDRSFNEWANIVVDDLLLDWDAELEEGEGKVKLTKAVRKKIKAPEYELELESLAKTAQDYKAFAKVELDDKEIEFSEENLNKYVKNAKGVDAAHNLISIIQGESEKEANYLQERLKKDVEDAKK